MLQARVHWLAGNRDRPAWAGLLDTGQSVVWSESPAGPEPAPLEVVLLALAASVAHGVLTVLRRREVRLTAYDVQVEALPGLCRPVELASIRVLHRLAGEAIEASTVERAIAICRRRLDPVGALLERTTRVRHVVEILRAGTPPAPLCLHPVNLSDQAGGSAPVNAEGAPRGPSAAR